MLMIFKKAYGDLHYATMHTDRQTNRVEKEKKKTGLRRKRKKQDWEREEKTGLQGAKFLTNESGVNWYSVIKSNCILWFLSDGYKKNTKLAKPNHFCEYFIWTFWYFDIPKGSGEKYSHRLSGLCQNCVFSILTWIKGVWEWLFESVGVR